MGDFVQAYFAYIKRMERKQSGYAKLLGRQVCVIMQARGEVDVYDTSWMDEINEGSANVLEHYDTFAEFMTDVLSSEEM